MRDAAEAIAIWLSVTCIALIPPLGYEIYTIQQRIQREFQQERQRMENRTEWFDFYEAFFIQAMSGDRYILVGPKGQSGAVFCKKI